mmetsp:Transcript_38407/g.61930  ORF Transcript_38407/g.61930 Transcript_38407/m.61930 type:complete len:394 (-) Transcript_38407:35-1216(-)
MHRQHKGIISLPLQDPPALPINLLQLPDVTQQHVVHLSHNLVGILVVGEIILSSTSRSWRQCKDLEVRDVDTPTHWVVLGADVQRCGVFRGRVATHPRLRKLVASEEATVQIAVFVSVASVAVLDVAVPLSEVVGPTGIAEGTSPMSDAIIPLAVVAVVHLLRRHKLTVNVRPRGVWCVPGMAPCPLRMVVLPVADVLLLNGAIAPGHGALSAHPPEPPLALVPVLARPHLSAVAMLTTILPLPMVIGFTCSIVGKPSLAVALPLDPATLVLDYAVSRQINTDSMSLPVANFALVGRAIGPSELPLACYLAGHKRPLVRRAVPPDVGRRGRVQSADAEIVRPQNAGVLVVGEIAFDNLRLIRRNFLQSLFFLLLAPGSSGPPILGRGSCHHCN